MELVIGTKRWSTWSLRPWLVLRKAGAEFTETLVELRQGEATQAQIAPHSPFGQVPVLKDGELMIWDSLAICEHLAERFPDARLWPEDPAARAQARAASALMHSGFSALRSACPMALDQAPAPIEVTDALAADLRRLATLWNLMLDRHGGPFLAGSWSIADAFFTPVASRLRTYELALTDFGGGPEADAYGARLLEDADFRAWEADARAEARAAV
ncbi:glutathione S-transferase family protein [Phenylobacterium sp.]|uniref:glutathione S-transferase family protein n=2 Tax=Phenylobacterium sp. TaxID=1871053 RepID=UPI002731E791|nr:glutathione S-transferase [Phenylobacterium sp.]MDP1617941.1 glutathione S-transferase [Phenylobacterium sp.]